MKCSVVSNFCLLFWRVLLVWAFLSTFADNRCLFSELFNVLVGGFNTRTRKLLELSPCGFGKQLLLISWK